MRRPECRIRQYSSHTFLYVVANYREQVGVKYKKCKKQTVYFYHSTVFYLRSVQLYVVFPTLVSQLVTLSIRNVEAQTDYITNEDIKIYWYGYSSHYYECKLCSLW